MRTFVSTGGLGDALICLLKVREIGEAKFWLHGTGHKEHIAGIEDVQKLATGVECSCEKITKDTREEFEHRSQTHADNTHTNYTRISTQVKEIQDPFISRPFDGFAEPFIVSRPYICIQCAGGRMGDSTKRTIDERAIKDLKEVFPAHEIVLLGPEHIEFSEGIVKNKFNRTGRTYSIIDALAIINECDAFVGHDGVMAYYAMMIHKPTIINWHVPNLPSNYMHNKWRRLSVEVYLGSSIKRLDRATLYKLSDRIEYVAIGREARRAEQYIYQVGGHDK